MSISKLPLLIIRPEPGASKTEARAVAMGFTCVKSPLFSIEPMDWTVPGLPDGGSFDAMLLTSANAAREAGAGLAALRGLPCLAVGEATAAAARSVGLAPAWVGDDGGGAALQEAARAGYRQLLWLSGEQHSPLAHRDVTLTVVPVYRARALSMTPALQEALKHPAIVLVHSQRAAWALADALTIEARGTIGLIAMSAGVAAVAGEGWVWTHWPETPRDESMLEYARALCQKAQP